MVLKHEIDMVRSLGTRPVVLTDAGELGFAWPYLASRADFFGTTLYRSVHNRVLGDIKYTLIPASFFRFKAWYAEKLWGVSHFQRISASDAQTADRSDPSP